MDFIENQDGALTPAPIEESDVNGLSSDIDLFSSDISSIDSSTSSLSSNLDTIKDSLTNGSLSPVFDNIDIEGTTTQTPGAGANNSTPLAQYGDLFSDAILSGLTTATSSTLSGTLASGVAYVLSQRVPYAGSAYTVAPSTTSYLDLSDTGVLTVSTSSTVTANSLRLWSVTSNATAITAVARVAPDYIVSLQAVPFLEVIAQSTTVSPTLTTSTTGGTIAASTLKAYIVLPVLSDGTNLPNIGLISTITTGNTTATNSNTISWYAVTGAVGYNVYSGPGDAVSNLPSFGLIGTTTSTSFVDTGITPGATVPGTIGSSFTVVPFNTVQYDTENGWDSSTNSYTIPRSGKWQVICNLRYLDTSPPGISYSLNANSTVADSASDRWFATPTMARGQTPRQGAINSRIAHFNQGDIISMFSYAGTTMNAQTASFVLMYMGN